LFYINYCYRIKDISVTLLNIGDILYILDIDEIRSIADSIGSSTSNTEAQFERLNNVLYKEFKINLPNGLKKASLEKFRDIISSPLVYERAVNSILKRKIIEGENNITIKNPKALYRIGILSFREPIKLGLIVEGSVGNFFAAGCNFNGTWTVKGHAENGLADKGYSGKIVVDGLATELAGQNNQATETSNGVDILVRKGCMERAMGQARGGSLITFGAGYNSGLYMSGGILLNLGKPGKAFGPGMVGGIIYSPNGTTVGEGATIQDLNKLDYKIILSVLKKFKAELGIEGLDRFSPENNTLSITNNGKSEDYNFKNFIKINSAE
jgi:methylamine---glutamate N-methyltransferase subunit B